MNPDDQWVPRKEAPDVAAVSIRTLHRQINSGLVRVVKQGRWVYCYRPDLEILRRNQEAPTVALNGTLPALSAKE